MAMNGIVLVVLAVLLAQDVQSSSTYNFVGRVCDKCPPGTYLVAFCKEGDRKSQCKECPEGSYSETENRATSCEPCHEMDYCPRGTTFKPSCTSTTDNKCECPEGTYWIPQQGGHGICVKDTTTEHTKPIDNDDYSTTSHPGSSAKLTVPTVLIICLVGYAVYRLFKRYRPRGFGHLD